jgi:hypothetical protein
MLEVVLNTNKVFIQHNMRPVSLSELCTFFGCVFAITMYCWHVGPRRNHWNEPNQHVLFPGLNLSSFISQHHDCLEDLLCNIMWGYSESHPLYNAEDLWWQVCQLVDCFNTLRKEVVLPGVLLCADESGTKWKGREYQGWDDFID